MNRAHRWLLSRVEAVKPHPLIISLFEMAFIQNREITPELRIKIQKCLATRQLTVVPEDRSRFLKLTEEPVVMRDQLLLNAMTISLYRYFGDYKIVSDMGRWFVREWSMRNTYDDVLDGIFRTEAWLQFECIARKQFRDNKFDITVDVSADNGEKRQFKVDLTNMDVTQKMWFTLPVHQITYSVRGWGIVEVHIDEYFFEKEIKSEEPMPFELTHEWTPAPWFSDIKVKTCMTYKPTRRDQQLAKDEFSRSIVMEAVIPSGMRVNERQINFLLSHVPEVMSMSYEMWGQRLRFFLNIPSTVYGKPICLDWALQRLSTVMNWAPMEVRVYDYLRPENALVRLFPWDLQPVAVGYTWVDAVHKARPSMEQAKAMAKRENGPWSRK
jgi:hypothetical protein